MKVKLREKPYTYTTFNEHFLNILDEKFNTLTQWRFSFISFKTFTALVNDITSSQCYKTFFGWNVDFPKIKKLKKVCYNVLTCTKMSKHSIFKQNCTLKLFISFKISYSCCFSFRGNLEFPDFLHKKFYNINWLGHFKSNKQF